MTAVASITERITEHTEEVRQRLIDLSRRNGGVLDTDAVIKDARNPKSPLHQYFTWDDRAAAHEFRVTQARMIIQRFWTDLRTEKKTIQVPFYIKDPSAGAHDPGYVSTASIRNKPDLALKVFLTETGRAVTYLERARAFTETLGIETQLERILVELQELRTAVGKD